MESDSAKDLALPKFGSVRSLGLPILTQSSDCEMEAPCLQEDSADDSSITNPFRDSEPDNSDNEWYVYDEMFSYYRHQLAVHW